MIWTPEHVEIHLDLLKTSTDRTVIYKCLVKLRTDLVKDKNGIVLFRTAGGVHIMVGLGVTMLMVVWQSLPCTTLDRNSNPFLNDI